MHQIDNSSAVTNMPALGALGTPGWFTPGDPGGAQDSTIVDADWANAVQAELLAVLGAAGIAWDKTKLNQVATAIQALIAAKFGSPIVAVGTITLDATYAGKLVTDNAAGVTITLPLAADVANGVLIGVMQQQAGTLTVAAQGTDKLMSADGWNTTSLALNELGAVSFFASDGTGHWCQVGKVAPFATNAATAAGTDASSIVTPAGLSSILTGTVGFFATPGAPGGWLVCNGATISRTTYANLWNAIGTTFGAGDGATTFQIPDLRGEFIRGYDDGRGVDSGRTFGSWQGYAIQSHSHAWGVNDQGQTAGNGSPGWGNPDGTSYTSAVGDSETRPRNVALYPCIKY